jgi:DNA-binding transcriptional regulator YiaG
VVAIQKIETPIAQYHHFQVDHYYFNCYKTLVTPDQLKRLRKSLALTQQGLADLLEVPQSTVGRWEAGLSSPRGLYLKALNEVAVKGRKKARKGTKT